MGARDAGEFLELLRVDVKHDAAHRALAAGSLFHQFHRLSSPGAINQIASNLKQLSRFAFAEPQHGIG